LAGTEIESARASVVIPCEDVNGSQVKGDL